MGERHPHHGSSSLAWMEEFGSDVTALHPCSCTDCMGPDSSELERNLAAVVSSVSALGR